MSSLIIYLFRFLSFSVLISPRWLRNLCGDAIGILWFDVLRLRRQTVLSNLTIAFPDWDLKKRTKMGRRSLCNMGRGFMDFLLLPYADKKWMDENFVFEGLENWEKAHAKGRGVLLLGLHLGMGDLALAGIGLKGIPISVITKAFKANWAENFWNEYRGRFGVEFIKDRRSSFDILKGLKNNRGVVFVLDQFHGPPIGIRSYFFGKETGTAYGLAVFALKTQAPVIPLYVYKGEDHKFHLVFGDEVLLENQNDRDKTVSYMTQKYDLVVEDIVRRFPQHWLWVHRRWKEYRD